ncbi:MAG: DUF6492 family protein [Cyanobacteria bacterium P01_A01_bin.45]
MKQETLDFVIPLYQVRWSIRAVLEGLTEHYQPRSIHIIMPFAGVRSPIGDASASSLKEDVKKWQVSSVYIHEEEFFFQKKSNLTKDMICAELDLGKSLYNPGWFYQQLLKLGASEGIDDLSEWYTVWDSDLLPVNPWPLRCENQGKVEYKFALLQHNQWGNNQIVSSWEQWIRSILGVEPLMDRDGTFIPHHMCFKQEHLESFKGKLNQYFQSDDDWLLLMMRSANKFGTFSEYWSYVSWVAQKAPGDLAFHPYQDYGETTERFFDDGTGLFSTALKNYRSTIYQPSEERFSESFFPSYREVESFIRAEYREDKLPSSLSFESSPRHLKKNKENMHIEELRSRWNPRMTETTSEQTN